MKTHDRIEEVRLKLRLNKGEICKELGIGRTMLHYLKTGERELSSKAVAELKRLEAWAERKKESEAMIGRAVVKADSVKGKATENERQLIFECEVLNGQVDHFRKRAEDAEVKYATLKKSIGKLLDEL